VSVVINTPVRLQTTEERFEKTTRVGKYGNGSVSTLAGAQVHLTSNQEFLAAALGRPRRFHYASRDKLHVVSHPALGYRRNRDRSAVGYESATVSLGIQAIHEAFAAHVTL
jgi:hypothetical protein